MRTTIILKEELLEEARLATGVMEKTALIHMGLKELIDKSARQRLAKLGGAMSRAKGVRRRRPHVYEV